MDSVLVDGDVQESCTDTKRNRVSVRYRTRCGLTTYDVSVLSQVTVEVSRGEVVLFNSKN